MFLRIDADGKILECKIPANKASAISTPMKSSEKALYNLRPPGCTTTRMGSQKSRKKQNVEIAEYSLQNQTEQFREARVVWLSDEQLIVIVRDITERKLAEDGLLESRRTLQMLMGNLPGMAYRCRNDRDWTMEFVSEGSFNLTGYRPPNSSTTAK